MPIKRPLLSNGEMYHIVIRAVDGLKIFRDEKDYFRMIHNLFEFNDDNPVGWKFRQDFNTARTVLGVLGEKIKRKLLVNISAFCFMPNHLHLLLKQIKDGGISKFMRKIGAGYGMYYNKKYQRSGHVSQGRYRAVHIQDDKQLITVFVYIHANPISLIFPDWKERGISDTEKAMQFLDNYRWSSWQDYLENKNFPSLTNREFLTETIGGPKVCRDLINDWFQYKKELPNFEEVAIE